MNEFRLQVVCYTFRPCGYHQACLYKMYKAQYYKTERTLCVANIFMQLFT